MGDTVLNSKRIAKNTVFLYFRMFLLIVIQLYTSRVVLDVLGAEDYGIYNLVAGVIVVMNFINNSMALAVNRYIAFSIGKNDPVETQQVFSMSVNIHILIAAVVIFVGETFGLWFINNKLVITESRMFAANIVYQTSVIGFVLQILKVPYHADIIANENMNVFAFISLFEGFAKLAVVFLLPFLAVDYLSSYSVLILLVHSITFISYFWYSRSHYEEAKYKLFWSKSLFKEMISYAGFSTFGNFATGMVAQGQSVLLNIFFGPTLNAARGLAVAVNSAVSGFVTSIFTAVTPQITKSYAQDNKQYLFSLVYNSTLLSYYLLFIICLPLILECDFVLSLWLKEVPDFTVSFVRLILINSLVYFFYTPSLIAIQSSGNVARIHLVTGSINLMNILITYLLWKHFNLSPNTTFIVQIFVSILMFIATIIIQKDIVAIQPREYLQRTLLPACGSSFIASIVPVIVFSIVKPGWIGFIVTGFTCVLSCLFVFFFFGITAEMRDYVKNYIKAKIDSFQNR